MHLQNGLAAAPVRTADVDLPVKAAGTEQGGIENVLPVGCGDDDDALVGREAVHLDEKLIECLLTLVMSAAKACTSAAAHGVDLVDEDDGGRHFFGLVEQVAHAACTDADVQLDKVGAGDRQERHAGFARDGAGQKRFAGARRADKQDALRNFCAQGSETLGIAQEFDNLGQLFLFFVGTGDVLEGDGLVGGDAEAGVGTGKLCHPAGAASVGPCGEHEPEKQDQAEADDVGQDSAIPGCGVRKVIIAFEDAGGFLLCDGLVEVCVEGFHIAELHRDVLGAVFLLAQVERERVAGQDERLDLFLLKQVEHIGIGQTRGAVRPEKRGGHGGEDQHQDEQQKQKA